MTAPARGWRLADFEWFYERLVLPDGQDARLEGFQRLILREIFVPDGGRLWTAAGAREDDRRELLVLIPKGQAKTTLMAALGLFHLLVVPNAQVFAGASDLVQASELFRTASHFCKAGSDFELDQFVKVLPGTREIRSRRDNGFIKVLASDDSKQGGKREGFNPTLALIDELHAHENDSLFRSMQSGLFKRNGLLATITTAGWDLEGVLGQERQKFLDAAKDGGTVERFQNATDDGGYAPDPNGRLTVARKSSGNSVMLEWALTAEDDPNDFAAVARANPASWVTEASLVYAKESLTPWAYLRYRCNVWTLGFESWLPVGSWEALAEPGLKLDPDLPLAAAIDMARYRDSAALVAVQRRPGLPAAVRAWIWKPGGQDDPVSYALIMDAIRDLDREFNLTGVAFDPKYMDMAAEELDAEGVLMEKFPQSLERMAPAAATLRQAILEKTLAFDPHDEHAYAFAAHIMAPVAKEIGVDQFKLDKSRRNGPDIDAAEALSMALAISGGDDGEPLGGWGV